MGRQTNDVSSGNTPDVTGPPAAMEASDQGLSSMIGSAARVAQAAAGGLWPLSDLAPLRLPAAATLRRCNEGPGGLSRLRARRALRIGRGDGRARVPLRQPAPVHLLAAGEHVVAPIELGMSGRLAAPLLQDGHHAGCLGIDHRTHLARDRRGRWCFRFDSLPSSLTHSRHRHVRLVRLSPHIPPLSIIEVRRSARSC